MHRRDSALPTLSFPFPGSLALLLPLKKVICGETFCTWRFCLMKNMQCKEGRSCHQLLPEQPAAFSGTASNLHFMFSEHCANILNHCQVTLCVVWGGVQVGNTSWPQTERSSRRALGWRFPPHLMTSNPKAFEPSRKLFFFSSHSIFQISLTLIIQRVSGNYTSNFDLWAGSLNTGEVKMLG